jgi:hypothetical protein
MNYADKIAKIIAKAEGTDNAEEAAIFMQKAQAMMEQHGIDLLELGKLDEQDPVGLDRAKLDVNATWKRRLATQVARFYGCEAVATTTNTKKVYLSLAGRQNARATFYAMWPFVLEQVSKLASDGFKSGVYGTRNKGQRYIANALCTRLHAMRLENEKALKSKETATVTATGLNSLVPVDIIASALEEEFGKLGSFRAARVTTNGAARADASKVRMDRQVGGAPRGAVQIGSA